HQIVHLISHIIHHQITTSHITKSHITTSHITKSLAEVYAWGSDNRSQTIDKRRFELGVCGMNISTAKDVGVVLKVGMLSRRSLTSSVTSSSNNPSPNHHILYICSHE
ncbi:MAG: hypothetical protein KDD36_13035, partial [Flavobacteriales bacterium]|nr:hypothetical protein [Flavobacteriales bacterium]